MINDYLEYSANDIFKPLMVNKFISQILASIKNYFVNRYQVTVFDAPKNIIKLHRNLYV